MSFSCWFIAYFHFLAERKLKISDVSSRNRTRKTIFVKEKIYSKVQDRAKEWGFIWQSRKLELQRTQFFFRNFVCYTKSCLKGFNFPAKKLRKNTGAQNTHAPFYFFASMFQTSSLINVIFLSYGMEVNKLKNILVWYLFSCLTSSTSFSILLLLK